MKTPSVVARFGQEPRRLRARTAAGQSLTEFTMVLPILLVLLVTVADFGRFFATAITIESAARTAAEAAATEYVRWTGSIDYDRIHAIAWQSVCDEVDGLPNAGDSPPGVQCGDVPTVVCVHDGVDPICTAIYNAGSTIPAECTQFHGGAMPSNAQAGGPFGESSRYIEVRVCYRFSTVMGFDLPFLGGTLSPLSGNFFIERARMFTVADY